MGNRLYVGNLSFQSTAESVRAAFSAFGEITDVHVVSDRETGQSRGFAFVTMLTVDEARRAVAELHDKDFMGRKLVVSGAKTSDAREGAARPQETHEEDAPTAT